jgi:hypothetical protein
MGRRAIGGPLRFGFSKKLGFSAIRAISAELTIRENGGFVLFSRVSVTFPCQDPLFHFREKWGLETFA